MRETEFLLPLNYNMLHTAQIYVYATLIKPSEHLRVCSSAPMTILNCLVNSAITKFTY